MAYLSRERAPRRLGPCRFPGCRNERARPWAPLCTAHAAWLPRERKPPDSVGRFPLGISRTLIFLHDGPDGRPWPGYEEACENALEQVEAAIGGEPLVLFDVRRVAIEAGKLNGRT